MNGSFIRKAVLIVSIITFFFFSFENGSPKAFEVSAESVDWTKLKREETLHPKVFDMGGAAAVSFDKLGDDYSCKIKYKKDGKTHTVKSLTNGFIYIDDLEKGKKYHATLYWTNGTFVHSEEFDIVLSKEVEKIVTVQKTANGSVTVSWKDFAPNQTYAVYRRSGDSLSKLGETTNTVFTDKTVKNGKNYTYIIRVKSSKNGSPDIKTDTAKTSGSPAPKGVSSVKADIGTGTLSWDPSEGASGYYIYRKKNGQKKYSLYENVNGQTSCSISKDNGYSYGVIPYVSNSDGSISKGKMKKAVVFSSVITGLTVSYSDSDAVLGWDKASENAEYHIYFSYSKTGEYKLLHSTKDNSYRMKIPTDGKTVYFRIMYTDGGFSSDHSSCAVSPARKVKLCYNVTLMSEPSWGGAKLLNLKKGAAINVFGKSDDFYYCNVNGKSGYIYERAVEGGAAPSSSSVKESNLNVYLDDILFRTGTSPKAIWNYVNGMKYAAARADYRVKDVDSLVRYRDTLSVNMIKYKSGICYHYAALSAQLLKRAGYSVKLAYCPHKKSGFHCYTYVKIKGKWQIFDACRHAYNNAAGYLPVKSTYLSMRGLNSSKEQVSDIL